MNATSERNIDLRRVILSRGNEMVASKSIYYPGEILDYFAGSPFPWGKWIVDVIEGDASIQGGTCSERRQLNKVTGTLVMPNSGVVRIQMGYAGQRGVVLINDEIELTPASARPVSVDTITVTESPSTTPPAPTNSPKDQDQEDQDQFKSMSQPPTQEQEDIIVVETPETESRNAPGGDIQSENPNALTSTVTFVVIILSVLAATCFAVFAYNYLYAVTEDDDKKNFSSSDSIGKAYSTGAENFNGINPNSPQPQRPNSPHQRKSVGSPKVTSPQQKV